MQMHSLWFFVCCFGVTSSEQETGRDGFTKHLYLMHLSREKVSSYNMRYNVEFALDTVNNDSRLLPGYRLHVVNGISTKSVRNTAFTSYILPLGIPPYYGVPRIV